jgi:hypothetical protein
VSVVTARHQLDAARAAIAAGGRIGCATKAKRQGQTNHQSFHCQFSFKVKVKCSGFACHPSRRGNGRPDSKLVDRQMTNRQKQPVLVGDGGGKVANRRDLRLTSTEGRATGRESISMTGSIYSHHRQQPKRPIPC